ncbi:unnamed protein product, partial [Closterium sp. NIES-54]
MNPAGPTCVMLGANTMAMFRAFILLRSSNCTTSAMSPTTQSSSMLCVSGSSATSASICSSVSHAATTSTGSESSNPCGSSRNHAWGGGSGRERVEVRPVAPYLTALCSRKWTSARIDTGCLFSPYGL